MPLQNFPEFQKFLSKYIANADAEADEGALKSFQATSNANQIDEVVSEVEKLSAEKELPLEAFGMEANRWFGTQEEAREWLTKLIAPLKAASAGGEVIVKDSSGTVLSEGDSVTVIKDLKVKGGSSDLKRGTLIKKIHLIGDPDNIECRVDGSTLVLKTIFLRKG